MKFNIFSLFCLFIRDYNCLTTDHLIYTLMSFVGCLALDVDTPKSFAAHIIPLYKLAEWGRHIRKRRKNSGKKKVGRLERFLLTFSHGYITHTYFVNILILVIPAMITRDIPHIAFWGLAHGAFTHIFGDDIDGNALKYKYFPHISKNKKEMD